MKKKLKICSGCGHPRVIWKNMGGGVRLCKECYGKSGTGVAKKPKPTAKPIPPRSSQKAKKDVLYMVMRRKFLIDHPVCMLHHPGICLQKSTEVHHSAGRIEDLYLDTTFWKAACRSCHQWAELHPIESKILGYSIDRLSGK